MKINAVYNSSNAVELYVSNFQRCLAKLTLQASIVSFFLSSDIARHFLLLPCWITFSCNEKIFELGKKCTFSKAIYTGCLGLNASPSITRCCNPNYTNVCNFAEHEIWRSYTSILVFVSEQTIRLDIFFMELLEI